MSSIFDKHWSSIFTDAAMHRLKEASPGPDSICISRQSFEDLVKVLEAVQRLNVSSNPATSMYVTPLASGFRCVLDNSYFRAEASGRTLLEALMLAFEEQGRQIDDRIR